VDLLDLDSLVDLAAVALAEFVLRRILVDAHFDFGLF
jgi:hypothetical protein